MAMVLHQTQVTSRDINKQIENYFFSIFSTFLLLINRKAIKAIMLGNRQ